MDSISTKNATVLIVDDDEDARHLLNKVMERNHYKVIQAVNGEEALRIAMECWREIDSVVLDIMMPGSLDGYEVCDRMRQDPHTRQIPVIILSARTSAQDMAKSYASGAFQHITKPYDIQHLEAVVASMIRLRRLETKVRTSADKYHAIVDNSPLEMLVLSPEMRIQEMNGTFRRHFPDAKIGDTIIEHVFGNVDVDIANHPVVQAVSTKRNCSDIVEVRKGDDVSYRNVHAAPILDTDGNVVAIIDLTEDVTKQKELEEKLRRQVDRHNRALHEQEKLADNLMNAQRELRQKNTLLEETNRQLEEAKKELERLSVTDGLTGLFNRRYFDEAFEAEIRRSNRYAHPISVLMMDIDHFKQINDKPEFGHLAGDQVLRDLSELLRHHLRETDTIARYGGEEFVAILPETDEETAGKIAERLRDAMEKQTTDWEGKSVKATISIGVASDTSTSTIATKLLEAADEALYVAKGEGRNRVALAV